MINRVILVGNLTRDAEAIGGSQTPFTRMRMATNFAFTDAEGVRQERSEFHNVVSFGRLAEICSLYCVRGRRVYVEGRLRTRDYTGSDGLRRWSTEVVAETMKLLDRPPSAEHADAGALHSFEDDPGGSPEPPSDPDEADGDGEGEPALRIARRNGRVTAGSAV